MYERSNQKILKILVIMLLDALIIVGCGGLALLTRFGFSFSAVPNEQISILMRFLQIQLLVTIGLFWLRRMYHYVWRAVSILDVADMMLSVFAAFGGSYLIARLIGIRLPTSIAFIDLMCQLIALVGIRCSLRFYGVLLRASNLSGKGGERIMLVGAGDAGRMLLQEIMSSNKVGGNVCCIIDDNPQKWGKQMNGVTIAGGRGRIADLAKKHDITQIIFAIPTATPQSRKEILGLCQLTGCKVKTLPGIYQLVNGEANLAAVKDIQVEDLLARAPVQLDVSALHGFLRDKVVLVTGGGGSIGSELCRKVVEYNPRQLIILDIYENNAYEIQQELLRKYPGLNLTVEIASVRDKEKTYELFETYRPDIVFHAAAHKHVPLMEACPEEGIKNNIFGTYHVVRAAEKYGVKKFVMISTDKAVNPTNFMGATKRFCEMILQSRVDSSTEFCAVRFGNVLGSNGSVVPLFKRQIQEGGPITITDKRIIRYFMTIPEAALLVIEAGAMAKHGEIFVLDMGEPVKILSLAENLIRLSGLEPYKDIEIKEIGLRPGEKLYEELLMSSQTLSKTSNEKIFVEKQETISKDEIMSDLIALDRAITERKAPEELIMLLRRMVPTYYDPKEINERVLPGLDDAEIEDVEAYPRVEEPA